MVRQQTSGGEQTARDDERSSQTGISVQNNHTNHSVRAIAITLRSDAQVPSRHIMAISGHRSEASIRNYNARPLSDQIRTCSDILSGALNGMPQESQHPSSPDAATSSNVFTMNPIPTVVHLRNTTQQIVKYQPQALSSLFSNCQVNNAQVFMAQNSARFHWTVYFSILSLDLKTISSHIKFDSVCELWWFVNFDLLTFWQLWLYSTKQIIWTILTRTVIG